VSGGKVLYTGSRKVKNRAAIAPRLGAHCLYHAKNYLGEFYRKMKWRLGAPQAVPATAHNLARIVYHMLTTKELYCASVFAGPGALVVVLQESASVPLRSDARLGVLYPNATCFGILSSNRQRISQPSAQPGGGPINPHAQAAQIRTRA
jgi:hypothetical protein